MIKLYRAVRSCQAERTPRFFAGHKTTENAENVKQRNIRKRRKRKKKKAEKEKIIKYKGNILLLALFESQHHSNTL